MNPMTEATIRRNIVANDYALKCGHIAPLDHEARKVGLLAELPEATERTKMQQHIRNHLPNCRFDPDRSVDDQVSLFNLQCFVGMIETGEATYDDFESVGGVELSAAIEKTIEKLHDRE